MVVLNITPQLTHLGTLCFLRGLFRRLVATKPTSCFKYRSSCYVRAETQALSVLTFVPHILSSTFVVDSSACVCVR